MNPLIEKFWNDAGYEIVKYDMDFNNSSQWKRLWAKSKNDTIIGIVGQSKDFKRLQCPKDVKCCFYIFNNQKYSEEDMLRIINLKAFI